MGIASHVSSEIRELLSILKAPKNCKSVVITIEPAAAVTVVFTCYMTEEQAVTVSSLFQNYQLDKNNTYKEKYTLYKEDA